MAINKIENLENILIHEQVQKELDAILDGWGNKKNFQIWLFERLSQLNDPNFKITDFPRQFEPIEELFAITYRNRTKNIRILYTVEQKTKKILLCSFDEKRRSDYERAKRVARQRATEIGGIEL